MYWKSAWCKSDAFSSFYQLLYAYCAALSLRYFSIAASISALKLDGGAAEQPSDVVSHDRHPEALGRGMERSGRGQDRVRQVRDLPDADAEPSRSGEPRAGQAGRHENARHPPPSQERHRALRGGNRARARRGGGRRADFIKN